MKIKLTDEEIDDIDDALTILVEMSRDFYLCDATDLRAYINARDSFKTAVEKAKEKENETRLESD